MDCEKLEYTDKCAECEYISDCFPYDLDNLDTITYVKEKYRVRLNAKICIVRKYDNKHGVAEVDLICPYAKQLKRCIISSKCIENPIGLPLVSHLRIISDLISLHYFRNNGFTQMRRKTELLTIDFIKALVDMEIDLDD